MSTKETRETRKGANSFARQIKRYYDGNQLTLLTRGKDVYEEMWRSIENAKDSIHLETYRLRADKTGREFAQRLQTQARAGLKVRVIYDAIGSFDIDPVFINRLRNAGVQVLEYHPLVPWRPRWGLNRRDHRKILAIDGKIAFTGGVNISDDHAPVEEGGNDWHDVHVKVEGPAAAEIDRLFRIVWNKETKRPISFPQTFDFKPGNAKVWVAANQEFLHRTRIRSAYLRSIHAAKKELIIANAYFVPDFRITRALAKAAGRGVEVKILVQGASDLPWVQKAGRYHFDHLLKHGVKIYEWPGPILHAKTAVADRTWSAVGSYNLDHRSLLSNLELNLHILDEEFSKKLSSALSEDIARSREITLDSWRERPLSDKIAERFWYSFRSFF